MNKRPLIALLALATFACSADSSTPTELPATEAGGTATAPASAPPTGSFIARPYRVTNASELAATSAPASALDLNPRILSKAPGTNACPGPGKDPTPVVNHGTPPLIAPVVNLIYWGAWSGRPYDAYWKAVANTPAFWDRFAEYYYYGGYTGSWGRSFLYPDGMVSTALTDPQLSTGIGTVLANAGYTPQPNDVFVVLLPPGDVAARDPENHWAGHHSHYASSGGIVVWAVLEPNSTEQIEWRSTHEVMEAVANPDGGGWTPDIGDPCNGKLTHIAGQLVQQYWSQTACRCVSEEDLQNVDVQNFGEYGFAPTVFRPSTSGWLREYDSSVDWIFGHGTDAPFTGDFDGDGITEFALLRQGPPTQTRIINIQSGVGATYDFGSPGDVAVPGDYDSPADGKTDLAMWQPALGWRYVSSATGADSAAVSWGVDGDIPVQADYDADGTTDFAVARPSDGTWYVLPSGRPGTPFDVTTGLTFGDIPVTGDYNGDGLADFAFWRPSTGTWFVAYSAYVAHPLVVGGGPTTSYSYTLQWGTEGDIPIGRDWDGDWTTDLIVYRPSTGHWFTYLSWTWTGVDQGAWGVPGDIPIGRTSTF
jgi:hypothetical protein